MPVSFSQMSMTTMPFLYQTRTLAISTWKRSGTAYQSVHGARCTYRNLSGSSRFQDVAKRATIPTITSAPKAGTEGTLSIKRTTNISGVEPRFTGNVELGHEKSSFTSAHRYNASEKHYTKPYAPDEKEMERDDLTNSAPIDFDEDLNDDLTDDLWGPDEIEQLTDGYDSRDSTITAGERRAFHKIFSDIFEGSQRPSLKKEDWFDDDLGEDILPRNKAKAKSKLDNILTNAIRRDLSSNPEGIVAAIERYPPALQAAAAKAIGLANNEEDDEGAAPIEGNQLDEEQLEALREPECTRIEGLMRNARSDFELWDVMEKEVFSLVAKLGLANAPTSQAGPKGSKSKKTRGKNTSPDAISEKIEEAELSQLVEADNGVSPLKLYGPLYPSFLLLGLRLLDRGFARPSALTLALLPKIKSFGFSSHVLGASTQFYNELLRIYHYRQNDFRGMLDLLTEMENSALDLNVETLRIVLEVIRAQKSIYIGDKGFALKALWEMPEFAPHKFGPWRANIEKAIYERTQARH